MPVVGLSLYTFEVNHSYKENKKIKKELLNLNNTTGNLGAANDIFDLLKEFCSDRSLHTLGEKSFKITNEWEYNVKNNDKSFRHLQIELQCGESGYTAPIIDINKNEEVYTKQRNQAEMKTLYVSIIVDWDNDEDDTDAIKKGFLIFETFGQLSVKTRFVGALKDYIGAHYDIDKEDDFHKYILHVNPVIDKEFIIKALREFEIKNVQLIATYSKDEANTLGEDGKYLKEKRIYSCFPKIQKMAENLAKALEKGENLKSAITVENFEYKDIRVAVKRNGKTRMIDIGDEEKNNVRIHLSNNIIGVDGYPRRKDLKKEVEEIYGTYSKEICLR